MRTRFAFSTAHLVFLAVAAASAAGAQATDAAAPTTCHDRLCVVAFDWGSGKTAGDYGPDRRYGSAEDFELRVRSVLGASGLRVSPNPGAGPVTITLRPTMRPKSMCDATQGTNTDYSCTAISDLQVTFATTDPAIKVPGSLRVGNRCGGDVYMNMAAFGQYSAETIVFALEGAQTKMKKPSAHC